MSYDYASRMLSYIKSGTLDITYDDQPLLSIGAKNNERTIDIRTDMAELMSLRNFIFKINKLKKISSNLKDESITLLITENGKPLATLGEDAKPGFLSRIFAGKNIEISKFGKKSKTAE